MDLSFKALVREYPLSEVQLYSMLYLRLNFSFYDSRCLNSGGLADSVYTKGDNWYNCGHENI